MAVYVSEAVNVHDALQLAGATVASFIVTDSSEGVSLHLPRSLQPPVEPASEDLYL